MVGKNYPLLTFFVAAAIDLPYTCHIPRRQRNPPSHIGITPTAIGGIYPPAYSANLYPFFSAQCEKVRPLGVYGTYGTYGNPPIFGGLRCHIPPKPMAGIWQTPLFQRVAINCRPLHVVRFLFFEKMDG